MSYFLKQMLFIKTKSDYLTTWHLTTVPKTTELSGFILGWELMSMDVYVSVSVGICGYGCLWL